MNFSFYTTLLSFIVSCITMIIWLRSFFRKLRLQLNAAQRDAEEGAKIAEILISKATSDERRADIYLSLTLRAIEFGMRRTQGTVFYNTIGLLVTLLMLFFIGISKIFEINYNHPIAILLYVILPAAFIACGGAFWYERLLQKLENGWQSGVKKAINTRVDQHLIKT